MSDSPTPGLPAPQAAHTAPTHHHSSSSECSSDEIQAMKTHQSAHHQSTAPDTASQHELTKLPTIQAGSKIEYVNGKPTFKPGRDLMLAFGALIVLAFAVAIDATSLSVALPLMSTQLGGTALEAFWSGTSFLLASTVLQPTVAGLSNIFGRKYLVYVTCFFFGAGSLIAALANDFEIVIVGRTIQGVGGGGLLALMEVITTDLIPLRFRGAYFSMLSGVWAVGTVGGPLIGAGFAQNVTWRWIFYLNLPLIGLGLGAIILFLNQSPIPGGIGQKLAGFDWVGSGLFTAASTGFLFGLTTGGTMYEWQSWRVLLPLIIGPIGLIGFGFWEVKFAKNPIVNKAIFANWDMIVVYIMTVFHGAILWSIMYFLVLYYQGVLFYKPVTSAVAVLPETLTVAPAAAIVGILVNKTGSYRWSLWIGWLLTTFGAGLLVYLKPTSSIPAWIFLNVPIGIGTGMLFPAMTISIQAACAPALNGQAAAFYSFLRTFGQSLGVAISGVIFQNVFRQKLQQLPLYAAMADQLSRDATSTVGVIQNMAPGDPRDQLVGAYNEALRAIWYSMIAYGALNLILSFTLTGYTLDQDHVTDQGLVEKDRSGSGEKVAERGMENGEATR